MSSPRERMLAGEWYVPDDPELEAAGQRARKLTRRFNELDVEESESQRELLSELLGEVGEDVVIRAPFQVDFGTHISIGPRTFVNFGAVMLDCAPITLGADVMLGPNVQLLTPVHPLSAEPRRAKWEAARPITIGDNVWLGGGAIVCPGVTIGENTVVGAGAVVTRDLPANVVAVGNPARPHRELPDPAEEGEFRP